MFARSTDVVGAVCVAIASFVNNSKRSKIIDKHIKQCSHAAPTVVGAVWFAFYYMLVNILKHCKIID